MFGNWCSKILYYIILITVSPWNSLTYRNLAFTLLAISTVVQITDIEISVWSQTYGNTLTALRSNKEQMMSLNSKKKIDHLSYFDEDQTWSLWQYFLCFPRIMFCKWCLLVFLLPFMSHFHWACRKKIATSIGKMNKWQACEDQNWLWNFDCLV